MQRIALFFLCIMSSVCAEKMIFVLPYAYEGGRYKVFLYKNLIRKHVNVPFGLLSKGETDSQVAERAIKTFIPLLSRDGRFSAADLTLVAQAGDNELFVYDIKNVYTNLMPVPLNNLVLQKTESPLSRNKIFGAPLQTDLKRLLEASAAQRFFLDKLGAEEKRSDRDISTRVEQCLGEPGRA